MANTKSLKKIHWFVLLALLLVPCAAFADKTSVKIEAPDQAALNSDIKIILHVAHKGNNFLHHTNWVSLKINDKEVTRWEYSAFKRPDAGNFTLEYTVPVTGPLKITAEGNCNIHGSAGPAEKTVAVQ
jgi:desulfoferrodoxin (superoxide reductase-like protein)